MRLGGSGPNSANQDIRVKVLTQCSWMMTNYYACTLPAELRAKQENFETFYNKRNAKRRLKWQN